MELFTEGITGISGRFGLEVCKSYLFSISYTITVLSELVAQGVDLQDPHLFVDAKMALFSLQNSESVISDCLGVRHPSDIFQRMFKMYDEMVMQATSEQLLAVQRIMQGVR